MARNPWETKEWRQKREEILKDAKCAICGSTEKLQVHHPEHAFPHPCNIKLQMYDNFYNQFKRLFQEKYGLVKYTQIKRHKHKSHPYWHPISQNHKPPIDETDVEIQYASFKPNPEQKALLNLEYKEWLKSIDAEGQIKTVIEKENVKYMSFENVQVICARCHFAIHKGMDLCPICKKNYKKIEYETCYHCVPEKETQFYEEGEIYDEDHPDGIYESMEGVLDSIRKDGYIPVMNDKTYEDEQGLHRIIDVQCKHGIKIEIRDYLELGVGKYQFWNVKFYRDSCKLC